jgi:regulator of nucleoside diphosphate kinase
MTQRTIKITQPDMNKLSSLLDSWRFRFDSEHLLALEDELDRAEVLASSEPPQDVVAMNSWVTFTDMDTGTRHEYQVVFPRDANLTENRISVLAPIGTAVLGYAVGHEIEWKVPGGVRRLRIEDVAHDAPRVAASGRVA